MTPNLFLSSFKADYGASTCHQSVDMQQIQQMFEKMYEEKRKNEEQASFGIPQGRRHFNTNNNHNTNNDMKRQYPISTLWWHVLAP
jgi:hypothetical protein